MQIHLLFENMTTIEYFEKWDGKSEYDNPYKLDRFSNFKQLFGDTDVWYLWFVPVISNQKFGNGTFFPRKTD